jgi:hypothetical protein
VNVGFARASLFVLLLSSLTACRPVSEPPDRALIVTTAPERVLSARPGAVRFAVIGDSGRGSREQYETAAQMVTERERFPFDFVIMLGDNIYGDATPRDYRDKFERPYRALLDAGVTFYAARGNHDVGEQWRYPLFNTGGHRYFTFRKRGGAIGALTGTDVQFFAIDTVSPDAAQLAWLERELRTSDARWKIAFFHHPIYTSGRYAWHSLLARRRIEPVLRYQGVDVVFSGHEHIYERIVPQAGVAYFVSGGAGSVRRGDFTPSAISAAGFDQDLHFMLVEIAGGAMRFEAISRTGRLVDAGEITEAPTDTRRSVRDRRAAAGATPIPSATAAGASTSAR